MSRKIVIWGCGGHGREVSALCQDAGVEVVGFLDERSEMKGRVVDDIPVLGDILDIPGLRNLVEVVCAGVGDPALKKRFFQKTRNSGFGLARPLIHPSAVLSSRVKLSEGCLVCAGSVLTVNIQIGLCVIVNRIVNVGHDCNIGDFSTLSPGCNLSGNVVLGEGVFVGTGASIREKIHIGDWSVIGGGSFVKDDVPGNSMVAGVPALLKKNLLI